MTLKAMIDSDIDVVFLNFDDFAENITLDGADMLAVVEEQNGADTQSMQKYEGTFRRSLRIFVALLDNPPTIGRRTTLTYRGETRRWTVKHITQEGEMHKIELEAVDS